MLVRCRECDSQVSDQAASCPKCGAPSTCFRSPDGEQPEAQELASNRDDNRLSVLPLRPPPQRQVEYKQSPGYDSLSDTQKTSADRSYLSALLGGGLLGFLGGVVLAWVLSAVGVVFPPALVWLIGLGAAIAGAMHKYFSYQQMVRINTERGLDVVYPSDGSAVRVVGAVAGAFALSAFVPDDQELIRTIDDRIVLEISQEKFSKNDNFGVNILKFGCRLDARNCAGLIRSTLQIRMRDLWAVRIAGVKSADTEILCVGAVRRWFCAW